ncbi:E3 SUMO-protein ligase ZBED1-like isoform X2 [Xyrauchen texanus]|uniref:E3 SUMO-protein ligase ZBED1-like isoform X2 n=1 Tax=Xyrauchen texanus TaxID=154827 RepID=UPI0022423CCA|nr:E3 SUMO-protein ligase ZBED1-like isoform X2 [Xyrauchen texanus]
MADAAEKITAAPSKYKADVWVHFGFKNKLGSIELDKTNAICKLCHAAIKYSGNTTNLRTHLVRRHADITLQQLPKPIEHRQTTLDNISNKLPSTSARALKITESLVHFICHDLRPYSVVENTGFRYMVNVTEPRYVIPTRKHITEVAVPRMYEEVKQEVKTSLASAERVALTCDGWTSRATESYITITAHHINENWELISHVLQTRAMHESHTGSNIAELLKVALEEWDIKSKDPAIVTDNASNMTIAAQLAGLLHFKCFAHTLNLASQRALQLKPVARLLGRVRRITSFFRRSPTASCVLREKQKLLNLPQHKLLNDIVTRWNSAHDMLQRFLEQQPAIHAALLSAEVRKTEKEICTLTESDITAAEEVVTAMKPMKVATLVMSEETTPTLSVVAPLLAQLIHDLQDSPADSNLTKEIKSVICQDLNKRYLNKEALYVASAMDPRFKALPFLSEDQHQDIYARITAEATRSKGALQNDTGVETTETESDVNVVPEEDEDSNQCPVQKDISAVLSKRSRHFLADLLGQTYAAGAAKKLKTAEDQAKEEMAKYKEEAPLPLSANPLDWWKGHQSEYPLLSHIAKR